MFFSSQVLGFSCEFEIFWRGKKPGIFNRDKFLPGIEGFQSLK